MLSDQLKIQKQNARDKLFGALRYHPRAVGIRCTYGGAKRCKSRDVVDPKSKLLRNQLDGT